MYPFQHFNVHVHTIALISHPILEECVAVALTQRTGIFDIRQYALLQCFPLHTAAVNCIAVNDVDGYLVTGSADGDIKVKQSGNTSANTCSYIRYRTISSHE